jgi:hypothetical protein
MRYVFGGCTLDTELYELYWVGMWVPLRPKVFQLLAYLSMLCRFSCSHGCRIRRRAPAGQDS